MCECAGAGAVGVLGVSGAWVQLEFFEFLVCGCMGALVFNLGVSSARVHGYLGVSGTQLHWCFSLEFLVNGYTGAVWFGATRLMAFGVSGGLGARVR